MTTEIRTYLTNLIEEKGMSIDDEIQISGVFGLTFEVLVDYIEQAKNYHAYIRTTLVKIDCMNGDVFDFLNHLAKGMLQAQGLGHYIDA